MSDKIGIGLVTYNSEERFKKSSITIPTNVDKFVIVNDGTPYDSSIYPKEAEVITHQRNLGVGCAKNTAMRTLLQSGCDHIFIMEDDIMIKNDKVFDAYINAAKKSGLYHLMFGYHGPANMKYNNYPIDGKPNPRYVVEYDNNIKIAFNTHCVGAFCYYLKGVLKNVGYNDEVFKNAWEHVEHSYRIVKLGLIPAYWWWPDLENSLDYLQEIASSEENSVISKSEEWMKNFARGAEYFKQLHSYYPTQVPDTKPEDVINKLKEIKNNYAK